MDDKTKNIIDDCDRPACDDMQSMFQKAAEASKKSKNSASQETKKKAAANMKECPAGSSKLGRSTWTLLHSMVCGKVAFELHPTSLCFVSLFPSCLLLLQAAWYPDKPSPEDRSQMTAFMNSLARFYPCTWCATDFQANVAKSPPATESRTELCQWVCEQHNVVNEKTGKPIFSCDMKTLDDRWRKSDRPECKDSYLYHGSY